MTGYLVLLSTTADDIPVKFVQDLKRALDFCTYHESCQSAYRAAEQAIVTIERDHITPSSGVCWTVVKFKDGKTDEVVARYDLTGRE